MKDAALRRVCWLGLLLGVSLGFAPAARAQATLAGDIDPVAITEEQMRAVEHGLAWLAANQNDDGSWNGDIGFKLNTGYSATSYDKPHVGVTALAGMAFLAGGHLPGRGQYGPVVEKALSFVLGCVQSDGYVTRGGTRMYSHAMSALFLAEIYGMTHKTEVRDKLQKSIDFIVASQNEEGAWRYEPYAAESDMSIVVCQVVALRAARNIGLRVPKAVVDRAARYVVDSAVTENSFSRSYFGQTASFRDEIGSFHYQKQDGSRSSFPLTAAGVTALHGLGIYSDDAIDAGISYLRRNLHEFNRQNGYNRRGHYFFWYGHYYGVQAMYTAGGEVWESYYSVVRDEILRMQEPNGAFPNDVGPGRAFGTAMGVLILEIPFRFLPIFQR
ncbi:MAG: terpene cyclase/mutase family protein [Planctomycetes bacterium]|nr:terpene cyclase/mutase family protein [Planctomycetota bacterium]